MTAPESTHQLAVKYMPVAELRTYHRNPRRGNVKAIAQSLAVNGQYRPLVVNAGTYTSRPNEVLAGNHTLIAIRDLGWSKVAAVFVDLDDDQCARIVAADNRTADLGEYDERLLLELLAELPDLDGTGYEPGDVDALAALLREDPSAATDDQAILDETDRAGWPMIRAQVAPDIYERWKMVEGEDDAARVAVLLEAAGC